MLITWRGFSNAGGFVQAPFILDEAIVYRILRHLKLIEPDPPPLQPPDSEPFAGELFDEFFEDAQTLFAETDHGW